MPLLPGKTRKRRRQRNQALIALGVGALFILVVVFVQPFAAIQWWLGDQLFLPTSPSPNIVIVAIDDQSLARYGKWSEWPRSLHAQAIDNLSQARSMVIGFDILFSTESAHDSALAEAMVRAGNVVIPAVGVEPLPPSSGHEIVYSDFLTPIAPLAGAAASIGHANVAPDGDGVIRRIPLIASDAAGDTYPAMVFAMLHTFFAAPLPDQYTTEDGRLHLLDRDIPVDGKGQMRVNFTGKPGTYTRLSYADVIEGNFDPETVRHKLVLVGMTATGEPDSWVTPVSAEKMYGVEIYANAMDTILRQRFLVETSRLTTALLVLLMVGVTGLVLPFVRMRWGVVFVVLLFVGYLVGVFVAFDHGYVLNILYPVLALPIMYATIVLCSLFAEQSDKRMIRELFGRYVSPQVAGEILSMADADELKLGGVKREVTVFFADMRGFTALSEQLEPEPMVATLNSYLSLVIERILANHGMVNKFAGDSIMAVWNAPRDQAEHALLAVKAALEAQEAIDRVQSEPSAPRPQFGIGINTGAAVAGNVGSEGRSEYTVIGDTVNVASRICAGTPGGHVRIGQQTYSQVKADVEVEELPPQHFKGKAEPLPVYHVLRLRSQEVASAN